MREEPGERVFDIPEDAIPVRPAQPKAVPVKPAASIPSAPKPQTAIHSAAPVSGDWWKALSENCKGQIPPMYRAFLDLCGGVLEGDQLTVFAPDEITLNRLDNGPGTGRFVRRGGKGLRPAGAAAAPGGRAAKAVPGGKSEAATAIRQSV